MSGLEPVAALGLACNILQVVEVGLNTIRAAKQVYKEGALDPALTENASALDNISGRIQGATTSRTTVFAATTSCTTSATRSKSLDKQLSELADKCQGAARELREEVNFLQGHSTRSKLVATLKITAKTTWRKRRLERLEGSLKNAQGLLQTGLLARVDERLEKTNSDLSSLDANLKSFIDEYRNGKTGVSQLVAAEAARTKRHITAAATKNEKAVKDHITERSGQLETSLRNDIDLVVRSAARRDEEAVLAVKRERLLRSLKFDGMNARRNQITPSHSGTFSWVLQDGSDGVSSSDGTGPADRGNNKEAMSPTGILWDSFCDWLRSTEPAYWVSGKPGSGKTTLMKYLLDHDLTKKFLDIWKPGVVLVSHFFWRPGPEMQQSIKGMLCSLLHQLLLKEERLANQLLQESKLAALSTKDADTDWSFEELLATFHEALSHYPRPIAMFLDGLDEVLGALRLLDVIEGLRQLDPHAHKLKMCLGSRREPLLVKRLCLFPQLRLEQVNRSDLRKYAMDNVKVPPDYHNIILCHDWEKRCVSYFLCHETPPSCDGIRNWLVHEVLDRAEGVFLWLCLTVNAITKAIYQGERVEDLEHRIRNLPKDLEDLYADMLARTETERAPIRNRAGSYFQLTLSEILRDVPNLPRTIFHLMIATTPIVSARLFAFETTGVVPAAFLIGACEATKRDIETACAGLLVCPTPLDTTNVGELRRIIRHSSLLPWHGKKYKIRCRSANLAPMHGPSGA